MKKTLFTKNVAHLDGYDYTIAFSGSDLKKTDVDLTKTSPALWAKGDFGFVQVF